MSSFTKKWFILYTKAGYEKKVSNQLTRKNIENYFPLKKEWTNKKRLVLEPLFNSYVFVKIEDANTFNPRTIDGVINFAYWLGKPAIVRNEEIEIMKRFLNEYSTVKTEQIKLSVNGSFKVTGNPVLEQKGQLVSLKNNSVKIALPSIGYMLIAELDKANIEIIAGRKQSFGILEKFRDLKINS